MFDFKEEKIIKVCVCGGNLCYARYLFMSVQISEVRLFKQSDVDLSALLNVAQIFLTLLIIIVLVIYYNSSKGLFCLGR